jgi:hypothetical protein
VDLLVFILRPSLTVRRLESKPSFFNTDKGFTVTNNTYHIVYLQTSSSTFEKIGVGETSSAQTAYKDYPVRNDDNTSASVYLTVKVNDDDGSVKIESGTLRADLVVTSYFK